MNVLIDSDIMPLSDIVKPEPFERRWADLFQVSEGLELTKFVNLHFDLLNGLNILHLSYIVRGDMSRCESDADHRGFTLAEDLLSFDSAWPIIFHERMADADVIIIFAFIPDSVDEEVAILKERVEELEAEWDHEIDFDVEIIDRTESFDDKFGLLQLYCKTYQGHIHSVDELIVESVLLLNYGVATIDQPTGLTMDPSDPAYVFDSRFSFEHQWSLDWMGTRNYLNHNQVVTSRSGLLAFLQSGKLNMRVLRGLTHVGKAQALKHFQNGGHYLGILSNKVIGDIKVIAFQYYWMSKSVRLPAYHLHFPEKERDLKLAWQTAFSVVKFMDQVPLELGVHSNPIWTDEENNTHLDDAYPVTD